MHNNYYFLRQLSKSLEKKLAGSVISECFSQHKEELILRFETLTGSFFIRASLLPGFSCLSFPENFSRARKNSVDLFEKIIGQRVLNFRQFENERSFSIQLSNNFFLLFKLHGNRSNILLFENDHLAALFKNSIVGDTSINPHTLDRKIDWSFETFQKNQNNLQSVYFTFGKLVWYYLETQTFSEKTIEQKWEALQQVQKELESPTFYITELNNTVFLSLVKIGDIIKSWNEPLKACNDFYYTFTQVFALKLEKNAILSVLHSTLHNSKNYLVKTSEKLKDVKGNNNYKVWADLIMANIHTLKQGADHVTVRNFYDDDQFVEINLKKDLSPQKNAEFFYKKAKNQHLEIERLQKSLSIKEGEIVDTEKKIREIESATDLKTIRSFETYLFQKKDSKKQADPQPYHEFVEKGFKIWVGKNAQSNDILTMKLAYKEDLWLHAKDVTGSHVLIKYQAGKKFPKDVIERAAQLAAYNSKRKTETLCPVVVTPKKYVRKRKGDPVGAVVVERKEVIMVEPKL